MAAMTSRASTPLPVESTLDAPNTVGVWRPQEGPQKALIDCPCPEIFFGGTRGGGKTDGVLGKWAIKDRRYGAAFNAIMFRPTTVSSEDAIERSKEIYGKLGGTFIANPPHWKMPHGGRVRFAYLESVEDADQYQGRNVTDGWIEEAGLYPTAAPIDRLFGVLRSAHGVPIQLILTANPGGPGQQWLRHRYGLVPFPTQPKINRRQLPNGDIHVIAVIPSRLQNNKILLARDPGYVGRLYMVGSAQLVKAWLDGDWTAIEGAFFDCWQENKHVIAPFTVPEDWLRFRSGDWGSASPFSIGWWAVVQDDYALAARTLPRGSLIRYREDYGASGPGKGLKLTAEQVAARIVERERKDAKLAYGVLDPSAFKEDGGPSIAERINGALIKARLAPFREADNARVSRLTSRDRGGPMGGWDQLRGRLIGTAKADERGVVNWSSGEPTIYCFSTCTDSIRTLPTLQHDPDRAEDLDTNSEDHAADEWRYAAMSRPWTKTKLAPEEPQDAYRASAEQRESDLSGSIKTL